MDVASSCKRRRRKSRPAAIEITCHETVSWAHQQEGISVSLKYLQTKDQVIHLQKEWGMHIYAAIEMGFLQDPVVHPNTAGPKSLLC